MGGQSVFDVGYLLFFFFFFFILANLIVLSGDNSILVNFVPTATIVISTRHAKTCALMVDYVNRFSVERKIFNRVCFCCVSCLSLCVMYTVLFLGFFV